MVAKDPAGFASPAAAARRLQPFFVQAEKVEHIDPHTPIRLSQNRQIASSTLPLTVPGWDVDQVAGRAADQRRRRQQRRGPRDQARRRPDLPGAIAIQPRGAGLPRRGDRPADRLRLARRRRPAAGDRADRAWDLLRRPDPPPGQRDRRPRLDHGGFRADRDRRRDRLLAAGPDPLPLRDEAGQGPPRRRGRGRHHRGAERDHRRLHRGDRRPRPDADRAELHVRRRAVRLDAGADRDARGRDAAAGAALLPRAEGGQAADPAARSLAEEGGRARGILACGTLEPRGAAPALAGGDRGAARPARSGGARPGHAPRLPGRRQRSAGHDDQAGLRPQHRGIRAGHERPDPDRRRPARRAAQVAAGRLRREAAQRARRRRSSPPPGSTRPATRR